MDINVQTTSHEGLKAAYSKSRKFYYRDGGSPEDRKKLVKRNLKLKRLNALLDLGVKL